MVIWMHTILCVLVTILVSLLLLSDFYIFFFKLPNYSKNQGRSLGNGILSLKIEIRNLNIKIRSLVNLIRSFVNKIRSLDNEIRSIKNHIPDSTVDCVRRDQRPQRRQKRDEAR